ncbi:hypothetical protein [Actinomadura kijaniata]|uniref:hypothetical protein n=1 Tax=Actinomadura kijaniata TaxID=46161 RepID=UPI00082989E8|nr:hypothetical protein [Actinomadura kijaniata]
MKEHLHTAHDIAITVWALLVAYFVVRFVIGTVRFIRAPRAAKKNYWLRFRVWARWRKHALALGLVYIRRQSMRITGHKSVGSQMVEGFLGAVVPVALVASVLQSMGIGAFDDMIGKQKRKAKYPRIRTWADPYGVVVRMRTVDGIGREEVERHASHLADVWQVPKVQVHADKKPGFVRIRAIKNDPIAVPLTAADLPAAVYAEPNPWRPYLGRDEWGVDRWLDLVGITGMTIGGLPRYGKTGLVRSLLKQWGGFPEVQFVFLDGKGSGDQVGADYAEWVDRAWMASGDDLKRAEEIFAKLNDHMIERGRVIRPCLGVKNGWHVGPSRGWPLIIVVVDECHSFFDEARATSQEEKKRIQRIKSLAADLPRKAGSVMMLSIFMTQKQTGDAIPTAIRDNCVVGASFAVKTRDAAVAGLGEGIREWPAMCPTTLRERPTYVGACTAALPDGVSPFVRLRVPYVDEADSELFAEQVAHLRADPDELLAAMTVRREMAPV